MQNRTPMPQASAGTEPVAGTSASEPLLRETPLLRVEHLRQYFGRGKNTFRAVDDVSFSLRQGEVLGLVGESGCGKTTTGRSIIRLYNITGGNVWFKGERINAGLADYTDAIARAKADASLSPQERRAIIAEQKRELSRARRIQRKTPFQTKIQMIFQDPVSSLDPRMTVREIVAEGLVIRGERNQAAISQKVSDALRRVGLRADFADRYPHEFSGGQRQRIGIARAIIMEPELIIADEPVSALDVSIKAQVINLLNDLRREMGLTILFIAHDLSVVKYFSDRIAVMYGGRIVETAPSAELFAHPLHPYTKSLLSAIPLPDPEYERHRVRLRYDPAAAHDYSAEQPCLREAAPGHDVLCSTAELERYKRDGKESA